MPSDSVYLPLQVGAEGKPYLGYAKDNTGNNISAKNSNYCELTGLYWAWKNLHTDYIGLVHYRRYFTRKEVYSLKEKRQRILNGQDWQLLLSHHPLVVPDKRRYYIETIRSHYNHAHHREGLDLAEQIIREKYPEYLPAFTTVMNRTWAHMFNMFVMKWDYFDAYMTWLFAILFTLETRINITGWDPYESRVFGFVSEQLLDVWMESHKLKYIEQNVSFMEQQNWLKKGGAFLRRKLLGK